MKVSFVVPATHYNKSLLRTIHSIKKQDLSCVNEIEIIVVLNNKNKSKIYIQGFERLSGVLFVSLINYGRSQARNMGIFLSSGEWVAFVDSDTILGAYWLTNLISESSFFSAGQGQVIPLENHFFLRKYRYWKKKYKTKDTFVEAYVEEDKFVPVINTAACLYRRQFLTFVNGFDEKLRRSEDIDLSNKAYLIGDGLFFSTKAKSYVYANINFFSYFLRSISVGFWQYRLSQKWSSKLSHFKFHFVRKNLFFSFIMNIENCFSHLGTILSKMSFQKNKFSYFKKEFFLFKRIRKRDDDIERLNLNFNTYFLKFDSKLFISNSEMSLKLDAFDFELMLKQENQKIRTKLRQNNFIQDKS